MKKVGVAWVRVGCVRVRVRVAILPMASYRTPIDQAIERMACIKLLTASASCNHALHGYEARRICSNCGA